MQSPSWPMVALFAVGLTAVTLLQLDNAGENKSTILAILAMLAPLFVGDYVVKRNRQDNEEVRKHVEELKQKVDDAASD